MLYKIVNMSDGYTVECPDLEIAAVLCVLLGNGQYALDPLQPLDDGEDRSVPMFFGDGSAHGWFDARFGVGASEVATRVMNQRREELAAALDSVVIGDLEGRAAYEAQLAITLEKDRPAFRAWWQNDKRSSTNDIGTRAWSMAAKLRQVGPASPQDMPESPRQVFVEHDPKL